MEKSARSDLVRVPGAAGADPSGGACACLRREFSGEPDAGNLHLRFDEGRHRLGIGGRAATVRGGLDGFFRGGPPRAPAPPVAVFLPFLTSPVSSREPMPTLPAPR